MLNSLRFQPSNSAISLSFNNPFLTTTKSHSQQRTLSFTTKPLALPQPLSSSQPSSHYISTVGSSSINLSHWNLTQRHLTLLQVLAVVTSICTTWLFCSAIPTLLAFKRAAESLEKLMDTTREELPDTMAAIRLSGMEISDLTNELSDLGQEITRGVKSSTRVVRSAEERLRRLTTMPSSSSSGNGIRPQN
ncbi:chitinase protein [Trifolium repens]|nr:chitinase protein [Trifolium repens]